LMLLLHPRKQHMVTDAAAANNSNSLSTNLGITLHHPATLFHGTRLKTTTAHMCCRSCWHRVVTSGALQGDPQAGRCLRASIHVGRTTKVQFITDCQG
jgi:hypothetical protein